MFTNQNNNKKNLYFMKLALNQAQKNLGNTKENPSVGCVIVKNGHLVGSGFTGFNGRPHAEINAINFTKSNLSNSSMYVTLEPCSHYGKTPPCINTSIKKNIKKLYFSVKDPDKRSFDKSRKILSNNGISVNVGNLSSKLNVFYKSYYKYKRSFSLPFVTSKLAVSKDYLTINKKKRWVTNNSSRNRVHLIRSYHDCVLTSSKTIIKDNPLLTCRIKGLEYKSPTRIVLDKNLSISINSKVIKSSKKYNTILFYNKINKSKIAAFKKNKIKLYKIDLNNDGSLNLKKSLQKLKILGFSRILIEAGKQLTSSFLNENLVDQFELFISSKKLNNKGDGSIKKYFNTHLKNKKYIYENVNLFGDKIRSYRLK